MRYSSIAILATALPLSSLSSQQVLSLPAEDRGIDLGLEPVFVLGELDGPDWAQFQSLEDAAFSVDGTLFLLDAVSRAVIAVSKEGTLRFTVGRRGEGPGEYRDPQSIDILPDGRLAVFDARKRAFLLYAGDGTHIEEVRPDLTEGIPEAPMEVMSDGTLLALPERLTTGRHGAAFLTGAGIRSIGTHLPILRVPIMGDGAVTVAARVPVAPRLDEATSLHRAFAPEASFGILRGDRIAVLAGEEYRVEALTETGTLLRTLERAIPVRPTSRTDRASYLRTLEDSSRPVRSLGARGTAASLRRGPEPWFYPVLSPALSIKTDGASSIWVLRRDPTDATLAGPTDLLSGEGDYLGTLPGGNGSLPVAFGPDGLVVFFEVGAFDEPIAKVYRLPESPR